jgi:hypothetical protein
MVTLRKEKRLLSLTTLHRSEALVKCVRGRHSAVINWSSYGFAHVQLKELKAALEESDTKHPRYIVKVARASISHYF